MAQQHVQMAWLFTKVVADPHLFALQVECDGKVLDLPEDIEGILLLNINSYMGGVDLWASGAWQPGQQATTKQSICDGRLEV